MRSNSNKKMTNAVAVGVGTAAGVVVALVAAWHGLIYYEVDVKCEKPKYTVIRTIGAKKSLLGRVRPIADIRKYAPVLVAEVTMENMAMREALGNGFRQIAGFIFGKNIAPGSDSSSKVAMTSPVTLETTSAPTSAKIAMTAPVAAEAVSPSEYKVSFIMPSEYTKDTLPKPINENVKIKEIPSRTMAALAWGGGSPSQELMDKKASELKAALAAAGIQSSGAVHLWQYHPPFAPSWMRKNELLLEVPSDVASA